MITTHVLDTSRGTPANGLRVTLELQRGGGWIVLGRAQTDANGRASSLTTAPTGPGTYRLTFETGVYQRALGLESFFPDVTVTFDVLTDVDHHVPLLLSPYGYSTYRGS